METFDLLVLANSRKHGGRCIAGLRYDALLQREISWVRLVDQQHDGTLWESQTLLEDGEQPTILDVARVQAGLPRTESFQVENLQIATSPWRKIEPSPPDEAHLRWLNGTIKDTSFVFDLSGDYLEKDTVDRWSDPHTLELVHPRQVTWIITTGPTGHLRCEVAFFAKKPTADERPFTLVVTDPAIEGLLLSDYSRGKYAESEVGITDRVGYRWDTPEEDLVFTISLGEPYIGNNRCYKLVAGVTTLPRGPVSEAVAPEPATSSGDICDVLRRHGLTVVDRLDRGGCLWVIGGPEVGDVLQRIAPEYAFTFAEGGGRATGHRPAWYWSQTTDGPHR